jgi:hypothetical protein
MGVYWIRLMLDSYTASRRRTGLRKKVQLVHGKKNRARALGFKNRAATKRFAFKGRKFALAA